MKEKIQLREVVEGDLPTLFEHQKDPVAARMAGFQSREWEPFVVHWHEILADPSNTIRAILCNEQIAGNVVCFREEGRAMIGYWVGREYWGRGIASQALARFLEIVTMRPLYALVASHNGGSIRVLEKSGFALVERKPPKADQPEELLFGLQY